LKAPESAAEGVRGRLVLVAPGGAGGEVAVTSTRSCSAATSTVDVAGHLTASSASPHLLTWAVVSVDGTRVARSHDDRWSTPGRGGRLVLRSRRDGVAMTAGATLHVDGWEWDGSGWQHVAEWVVAC
jgi:hypothetical protein